MSGEIKVPSMGESITEATVGAFIKNTGDFVSTDDELIELETDKVNQVLYAPESGVVTWNVSKDDVVKIGQVIGTVDSSKSKPKEGTRQPTKPDVSPQEAVKPTEPVVSPQDPVAQVIKPEEEPKSSKQVAPPQSEAAPRAPSKTAGSARFGKDKYVQAISEKKQPSEMPAPTAPAAPTLSFPSSTASIKAASGERETRKKMSKIRKVIASRLVEVQQQTAMLTTFNEVDMTRIIALRDRYKEQFAKQHNSRLGFMPFFVKACVAAMKMIPEVNAYIDGDDIVYRNYFDIGIAVGTDKGVMVPVVRGCDTLSFAGVEQAIELHAKKAREGGLTTGDLQGGGFTITNGGVYGSLLSTPIINPPQSAILGMHKIMKRPVVVDDQIVIRQMMYLALSYDHRIIDGKEAVSFLVHIKNCLEDPSRLLLDII